MRLIAFRPEYQITVDPVKNRIFYKFFAEMNSAQALPDFLPDWQRTLAQVQPGFTILTDTTQLTASHPDLLDTFVAAQALVLAHGVGTVAEIHRPGAPTEAVTEQARNRSALSVRRFVDLWEADKFLDELSA